MKEHNKTAANRYGIVDLVESGAKGSNNNINMLYGKKVLSILHKQVHQ